MRLRKSVSYLLLLLLSGSVAAQSLTAWQNGNSQGIPGADYWQQQADYTLSVTVDPESRSLTGVGSLTYHNNSPKALSELWLELPQQLFRDKGIEVNGRLAGTRALTVTSEAKPLSVMRHSTYYRVTLDEPLPAGQQRQFRLSWDLQLIDRRHALKPRAGFETFADGSLAMALAQWFPRVLAYDSSTGWQRLPFGRNGEFHLETGNYEVTVTAPGDMLVAATGNLTNANQVLSEQGLKQYRNAGEQVQFIRAALSGDAEQRQWRFEAKNVRDFSIALSNNWVWERRKIATQGGKTAINVYYPDNGRYLWQQYAMQAVSHAVEFMDAQIAPFPDTEYSVVNIAGLGMEYPGITWVGFRGPDQQGDETPPFSRTQKYDVIGGIIHEVAHVYFPMLVNTNERAQGFFDEGLTSFIAFMTEQAYSRDFQSFYGFADPAAQVMAQPHYTAPVTQADALSSTQKLDAHYHIPAVSHVLLREYLGEAQFDRLLTRFIRQWRGKRAYFADWIHFVEQHTNKALDWFWLPWLESHQHLDLAVIGMTSKPEPQLIIENRGGLLAPVEVNLLWQDGRIERRIISPSQWEGKNRLKLPLPAQGDVSGAVLDPQRKIPDTNRQNNRWYPN
ncbi:hypothetical protein HMF8227_00227 [Saliniradius amylolyticus]|uniref:Peptidase M1 membrane alanine aminopeptidase domain-containing protein n=1 Tax=Saliniradius amylolyticus TaxID=2183582 RepID=A0A2S2DZ98_9ALTE|nr:M1 family metallopeptidase [Saliniradius amylolyticus]AWL10735.1 hypothetical protein HMF8227_00227 [Saliniradius amylolyticus]